MHKYLIKNKIKKILKHKEDRQKRFLNLKKIHTILILLDTEDYEEADVFIDHLERMGKKVTSYAYKNKNDEYDYSETPYIIIDYKKISKIFEKNLTEIAENIKKIRYDALFDLTVENNPVIEFLVASAEATFKVGYKKSELPLYDFTIGAINVSNEQGNVRAREFGRQILHYLSTIKSE
jgi:hypothetical protein